MENNQVEQKQLEENAENVNITYNIEYKIASFSRRVMANLIDILIFAVSFVSLILMTRAIVNSTSAYKDNQATIDNVKIESCLFEVSKNDKQIKDITVFYHASNDYNATAQRTIFVAHIEGGHCLDQYFHDVDVEGYFNYIVTKATEKQYNDLVTDYDNYRLSDTFVDSLNEPYFIKNGDEVIVNPNCQATDIEYVKNVYVPYIQNTLVNTLVTCVPEYYSASKFLANMVSFVEIPVPYLTAGLITYIVPIFIFRRGRKTWGKAIYGIGLIDSRCLIPTPKRTAVRFAIFYVGELILSLFTLGAPFLISFSMMAFSKKKQGFPDYMLGIVEVDTHNFKIFFDKDEITFDDLNIHKKPVDFRRTGL